MEQAKREQVERELAEAYKWKLKKYYGFSDRELQELNDYYGNPRDFCKACDNYELFYRIQLDAELEVEEPDPKEKSVTWQDVMDFLKDRMKMDNDILEVYNEWCEKTNYGDF